MMIALLFVVLVLFSSLAAVFYIWWRATRLGPVESQVMCDRCKEFVDLRSTKFNKTTGVYQCQKSCSPMTSNVVSIKPS